MNRKLIMGETFEIAMMKNLENQRLSEREKLNWIDEIPIIQNPLSLRSADLELRLFTYKLANSAKSIRPLTNCEIQSQIFINRLYDVNEIQKINDIFAIEFNQEEMNNFKELLKWNQQYIINKKKINPEILSNKRVWRVVLLENLEEYELRKSLENISLDSSNINPVSNSILSQLQNLKI